MLRKYCSDTTVFLPVADAVTDSLTEADNVRVSFPIFHNNEEFNK
jgi:hypothetical protein